MILPALPSVSEYTEEKLDSDILLHLRSQTLKDKNVQYWSI